jgi:hypothetical protein
MLVMVCTAVFRSELLGFFLDWEYIGADVGVGAVRLEHQFYALGQAAANACDIALSHASMDSALDVQDVPYDVLRGRLLKQGAVIDASSVGKPDFSLL